MHQIVIVDIIHISNSKFALCFTLTFQRGAQGVQWVSQCTRLEWALDLSTKKLIWWPQADLAVEPCVISIGSFLQALR